MLITPPKRVLDDRVVENGVWYPVELHVAPGGQQLPKRLPSLALSANIAPAENRLSSNAAFVRNPPGSAACAAKPPFDQRTKNRPVRHLNADGYPVTVPATKSS